MLILLVGTSSSSSAAADPADPLSAFELFTSLLSPDEAEVTKHLFAPQGRLLFPFRNDATAEFAGRE